MKSSGIGGQAVLEGIMMRHNKDIAVAVRKPDGNIAIGKQQTKNPKEICKIFGWPIIRGIVSFIFSLVIGIRTLMFSASFFAEEVDEEEDIAGKTGAASEDAAKTETEFKVGTGKTESMAMDDKEKTKGESAMMFGTLAFSLIVAIVVFMLLPYWAATGILKLFGSDSVVWLSIIEGIVKLGIFIGYIALISLMKDIRRTFMYHGSEHKCINCIEGGHTLTVDNVMAASREHRRCGTSFIFFVLFISIIFFIALDIVLKVCFHFDSSTFGAKMLRMLWRLVLVPIVAGISFEFIQWAGNSDSKAAGVLSKPGLWIQALTTKEPTPDMVEVAIASVEAVFDWRAYLKEQGVDITKESKKAEGLGADQAEEASSEAQA